MINRWHWLSHSEGGLRPRAAHTAIYIKETDSLYVFGGYDLNYILSNLEVYRFSTSQWEDEYGNELGKQKKLKCIHYKCIMISAVLENYLLSCVLLLLLCV